MAEFVRNHRFADPAHAFDGSEGHGSGAGQKILNQGLGDFRPRDEICRKWWDGSERVERGFGLLFFAGCDLVNQFISTGAITDDRSSRSRTNCLRDIAARCTLLGLVSHLSLTVRAS
jgi:hypothetical protein